jgi:hypothetical protein
MGLSQKKSNNFLTIFAFIVLAVIYAATLHGISGSIYPDDKRHEAVLKSNRPPFETSLERGRFAQTVSIGERHTFNVDPYTEFLKPDLAWFGGHFYPAFPPGVALLSSPLLLVGERIGYNLLFAYATTTIAAILTGIVLYKISRKLGLSQNASLFGTLVLCLASGFWSYSVTISAHPFSTLVICLMFLAMLYLKRGQGSIFLYSVIWFFFSINLFIDYPNVFIALPILIYSLYKGAAIHPERQKIRLRLSFKFLYGMWTLVAVVGAFALYNTVHYHKPFAFTNQYNLQALDRLGVKYDIHNLNNSLFKKKAYSNRFQISRLPEGVSTLTISTDRGLFFFFPIFFIGIVGLIFAYKDHKNVVIVTSLVLAFNLILYSIFDDPWGGWSYGPRYLLPSLPLLALFVGFGYEWLMRRGVLMKAMLLFLLFASVGVALLGPLATNAVPPAIEASRGVPSNFVASFVYIPAHGTSSFIYNQFVSKLMPPFSYVLLIFAVVTILFTLVFATYKKNEN